MRTKFPPEVELKSFSHTLTGAAFTFPLDPMARHCLAEHIRTEEEKRHGVTWRMCLRKKAGSTKASAIFLDSLDPPGCLKKAAFKVDKMMRKLFDPPAQEPDTWYGRLWSKGKLKVTQGFVPLLKTSSFIFDYVKDGFFFYYAVNKIAFITSSFIKGLIIFHGTTILASGVLMGMVVQMDRALIN